jgi:hypothetical protein
LAVDATNIVCDVEGAEDAVSRLENIAKTGVACKAEFLSLGQGVSELPSLIPQRCPGLANRFESLQNGDERTTRRMEGRVYVRRENEIVDVIVRDDVESVKRLIGGRDARKMKIQWHEVPPDILLPDPCVESVSLIEVAAGGGAERTFGLLHTFFGMEPTEMAFELAIVNGHRALVRSIWDRLPAEERVPDVLLSCAESAAEYHHPDILTWLVDQPEALCGGESPCQAIAFWIKFHIL